MNLRMTFLFLILTTVFGLAGYYIGTRAIHRSVWAKRNPIIVWSTVSGFVLLQFCGPLLYRSFPTEFGSRSLLSIATYGSFAFFIFLLVFTAVVDFLAWNLSRYTKITPNLDRRFFLGGSVMSLLSTGGGALQAFAGPKVHDVRVPIQDLPMDLEGLKIVQISDLHVGPLIDQKYTENVVEIANSLDPDIVALTGDFVDGSVDQLRKHIGPLANLKSKYGIFYITGNHEYYWGVKSWIEEFRRLGAVVLLNEHRVVQVGGAKIVVAGVTDYSAHRFDEAHRFDPERAIQHAPANSFKLLLAHQPTGYEQAHSAGFDLQLSGHTHGGQFFPWKVFVALFHRYYEGLNRHKKMWIYVNRGTGYWGPPTRLGVPSEVSLLRLVRLTA